MSQGPFLTLTELRLGPCAEGPAVRGLALRGPALRPLPAPLTSAQNDGCDEEGQVTVVKFQGVELDGKLELRLNDVTERLSEAAQELPGDEAGAVGHQQPVLVDDGGQHGKDGLMHTVLQQGHLVVEEEVAEAGDALGELGELTHGLHRGALAAVEDVHTDLLVGGQTVHQLLPDQALLRLPQRLDVVDHKGLQTRPG